MNIFSDPLHLSLLSEAGVLVEAPWSQVPGKILLFTMRCERIVSTGVVIACCRAEVCSPAALIGAAVQAPPLTSLWWNQHNTTRDFGICPQLLHLTQNTEI